MGARPDGRRATRHQHLSAMRGAISDQESVALMWDLYP
jgi:hypothetical protein